MGARIKPPDQAERARERVDGQVERRRVIPWIHEDTQIDVGSRIHRGSNLFVKEEQRRVIGVRHLVKGRSVLDPNAQLVRDADRRG